MAEALGDVMGHLLDKAGCTLVCWDIRALTIRGQRKGRHERPAKWQSGGCGYLVMKPLARVTVGPPWPCQAPRLDRRAMNARRPEDCENECSPLFDLRSVTANPDKTNRCRLPTWAYAVVPIATVIPMGMIMVVVMIVVMVMS